MADPSGDEREAIEVLAEEFLQRRRRGETPSMKEYVERYPELADEIRELFPALAVMHDIDPAPAELGESRAGPPPRQLGDYRILRTIGRGGMGVVYEAEQLSLGRRVALKILSPQAVGDGRARERFRREARAAARLHHTNIVPVFDIGEEGASCYYAMQLIPGQGLDRVIEELRRLRARPEPGKASPAEDDMTVAVPGEVGRPADSPGGAAYSLLTGGFELRAQGHGPRAAGPSEPTPLPTTASASGRRAAGLSTSAAGQRPYYRSVACVGQQAAQALAYAHARGVVHRDVKPSNLLLDEAGVVWVTDFGLAKTDDDELTRTGELPGTLRYISPERFQGHCDERADVYALGLTLYELLVLEPAFASGDRLHLMEQIRHRDPPRPRAVDPRVPRDLETVVLKAIDKDPGRRYRSTADLGEDLRRFLADEPIRARRAGTAELVGRWCRRNPAVAISLAAVFIALAAGAAAATFFGMRANANARAADESADQARRDKTAADRARKETEAARDELQEHLYFAEMNLAGQAAESPGGIRQVEELLVRWQPTGGEPDRRGWEWYFLRGLGPPPLLTLRKHAEAVGGVSWSPDGRRLATPSDDHTIKLWDANTGREVRTLRGHDAEVWNAAWRPDGRRLASAGNDGTVRVWDPDTGRELRRLRTYTSWRGQVSWSPDGRRLACPGRDNVIRLFDAETGREVAALGGHAANIYMAEWSPDGRRLASAARDGGYVWDAASGAKTGELCSDAGGFGAVAWSPDGRRLAGSVDGEVKVWDADTIRPTTSFTGHTGSADAVRWSPDGKRVASGGSDQTVRVWDPDTGRETAALRHHTSRVRGLAWSPDGRRLASASVVRSVNVWDAAPGRDTFPLAGQRAPERNGLSWSPDGSRLAAADGDAVRVWDREAGREVAVLRPRGEVAYSLSWSPDGRRLAEGDWSGTVRVWDVTEGRELAAFPGHSNYVADVSWSPDGRLLASAAEDRSVRIWDVCAGRQLGPTLPLGPEPHAVRWSLDGRRLAVACADTTVRVWDMESRQELAVLRGHADQVAAVSWSPDGRRLVTGSLDGTIRLWDGETYDELRVLRGHAAEVQSVCWSPDGRRLASGGGDRVVKIWDAATGRETVTIHGHTNTVAAVVWNPDGLCLASGGEDHTVRLWDAAAGYREERSPLLLPELTRRIEAGSPNACDLLLRAEIEARQGEWERAVADWTAATGPKAPAAPRWFEAGWWVAGTFPEATPGDVTPPAPPWEEGPGRRAAPCWRPAAASANGGLDLAGLFPRSAGGAVHVLTRVYSPCEQAVAALVGSSGPWTLQHDGRLLRDAVCGRTPAEEDEAVPLTLLPGWNTLLFRTRLGGAGRLAVRLSVEAEQLALAEADSLLAEPDGWEVLRPAEATAAGGATLTVSPDGSVRAGGKNQAPETYTLVFPTKLPPPAGLRLELLPDPGLPANGPGRAANGNIRLSELRLSAAPEGEPDRATPLTLTDAWADFSEGGFPVAAAIDGDERTAWAVNRGQGQRHAATFAVKGGGEYPGGTVLTCRLLQGPLPRDHTIGRFRLSAAARPEAVREERRRAGLLRNDLDGWTMLGAARYLRGEWPAALAALRNAPAGGDGRTRALLALVLAELGQSDEAAKWADEAFAWVGSHATDEQLRQFAAEHLSRWLKSDPPANGAEARVGRARLDLLRGEPDRALAEATHAVNLRPDSLDAVGTRVEVYLALKKWSEALADCDRAVTLDPGDLELRGVNADLLAHLGKYAESADKFGWLAARSAIDTGPWWRPEYRRCLALLLAGDSEGYRKGCAEMVRRFKDIDVQEVAFFTTWACCLGPDAGPDDATLLRLVQGALAREPHSSKSHLAAGAVLYRLGRAEDALPHLRDAVAADPRGALTSPAYSYFFLAMSHHRLGHADEAHDWLDKAKARTDEELRDLGRDARAEQWVRRATLTALRTEAEARLRGPDR